MSTLEKNTNRTETKRQIDALYSKLSRLPVGDLHKETEAEIKKLTQSYNTLPFDKVNAGNIFLSKKTVYEGPRYHLREFKGKLWLYDQIECITDRIEYDTNGEPVSASVFVRNSEAPEGKELIFNLLIDQPLPEEPKGKRYKLKFHPSWNCPQCNFANPLELDFCNNCRIPRPENLAINQ